MTELPQMGQGSGLEYVPSMYKVLNSIPSREWSVYRYGFSLSYLNPNSMVLHLTIHKATVSITALKPFSLFLPITVLYSSKSEPQTPHQLLPPVPKPYTLILSFSSTRNATFLILSLQMDIYLYPLIKLLGCWALNLEPNMY